MRASANRMSIDWSSLDAALERHTPVLWWRDDDAIAPSRQLDRLLSLAEEVGAPLTLAVIPAYVSESLAFETGDRAVSIAVHGWRHDNHAPSPQKKAEFGVHRPDPILLEEARLGLARTGDLFGDAALPLFVPPWNRMASHLPALLTTAGYRGLSAFAQRAPSSVGGLARIDSHIDPIDWRGTRSAIDPQALVDHICGLMASDAPIGLMTHHRVHDDAIWDLTTLVVHRLTHRGASWVSAASLMDTAVSGASL